MKSNRSYVQRINGTRVPYRRPAPYRVPTRKKVFVNPTRELVLQKKIVKAIDRRTETKKLDVAFNSSTVLAASTLYSTNIMYALTQGTSDSNRIGDVVIPVKLELRGVVESNHDSNLGQLLLIKHKLQPFGNLTSLNYSDVFIGPDNNCVYDRINEEGLTVVKQWRFNTATNFANQDLRTYFKDVVKLSNSKFQYDGANSGYGKTWTYHLVWVNEATSAVGAYQGISLEYTLYFKDA